MMEVPARLRTLADLACRSESSVLITGPTGAGKTRLARWIHERSSRRYKPFVTVNLASLHEGTLESELFGHEKGAFTGADRRRAGRLEKAQGGTVFLDEIGELSPRLQARLLEFLHSKIIAPIGSGQEIHLDVRIIAATHRNLEERVANGEFREDLFHRLRIVPLKLPALSERSGVELDALVHSCLAEACKATGREVLRISEPVARRIEVHEWPGNLRELYNVLEFAVQASSGPEILVSDLPPWFLEPTPFAKVFAEVHQDYPTALGEFEKRYLEKALKRFHWRVNRTAREIGMNKTKLIRRMQTYGLGSGL